MTYAEIVEKIIKRNPYGFGLDALGGTRVQKGTGRIYPDPETWRKVISQKEFKALNYNGGMSNMVFQVLNIAMKVREATIEEVALGLINMAGKEGELNNG